MKIVYSGNDMPQFRRELVEHVQRMSEVARHSAYDAPNVTQKTMRYYEGKMAALQDVADFLQGIMFETGAQT